MAMRTTTKLLIAILMLAMVGILLISAAVASEADATACLDQLVNNASAQGYRLRNTDTEQLAPNEAHGYTAVFTKGREYLVFACGDAAARDLDIYLYDEGGDLVFQDRMSDAQPIVTVTPEWTGSYTVVVKLYDAEGPASYAMAVMYK